MKTFTCSYMTGFGAPLESTVEAETKESAAARVMAENFGTHSVDVVEGDTLYSFVRRYVKGEGRREDGTVETIYAIDPLPVVKDNSIVFENCTFTGDNDGEIE